MFLVFAGALSLAATSVIADAVPGPMIVDARMDATTLHIQGANFDGVALKVTLGGYAAPLVVIASTATQIDATLPAGFVPGSYLLTVSQSKSASANSALVDESWVTLGAAGPQGPAGPAGPMGLTGQQGLAGAAGPQGQPGPQGPQGAQGTQGPQGSPGAAGAAGAQGPAGPQGEPGPKGDPGPATFLGATSALACAVPIPLGTACNTTLGPGTVGVVTDALNQISVACIPTPSPTLPVLVNAGIQSAGFPPSLFFIFVQLTNPVPADTLISLASQGPAALAIPATLTIPAGNMFLNFGPFFAPTTPGSYFVKVTLNGVSVNTNPLFIPF